MFSPASTSAALSNKNPRRPQKTILDDISEQRDRDEEHFQEVNQQNVNNNNSSGHTTAKANKRLSFDHVVEVDNKSVARFFGIEM